MKTKYNSKSTKKKSVKAKISKKGRSVKSSASNTQTKKGAQTRRSAGKTSPKNQHAQVNAQLLHKYDEFFLFRFILSLKWSDVKALHTAVARSWQPAKPVEFYRLATLPGMHRPPFTTLLDYEPFSIQSNEEIVNFILRMTEDDYKWIQQIQKCARSKGPRKEDLIKLYLFGLTNLRHARLIDGLMTQAHRKHQKPLTDWDNIKALAKEYYVRWGLRVLSYRL